MAESLGLEPEVSLLGNDLLNRVAARIEEIGTAPFFCTYSVASNDADLCLTDGTN